MSILKVLVYVSVENNSMRKTIERFIQSCWSDQLEIVTSPRKALMVFTTRIRDICAIYNKETFYCMILPGRKKDLPPLPENIRVIEGLSGENFITDDSVKEELCISAMTYGDNRVAILCKESDRGVGGSTKKILIVDDLPSNLIAAKKQFSGSSHDVSLALGYTEGLSMLEKGKFDVVLTDLMMPMTGENLHDDQIDLSRLVAYGFPLALLSAKKGVSAIAVVSNTARHKDFWETELSRLCEAGSFTVGKSLIQFYGQESLDSCKDWTLAFQSLIKV